MVHVFGYATWFSTTGSLLRGMCVGGNCHHWSHLTWCVAVILWYLSWYLGCLAHEAFLPQRSCQAWNLWCFKDYGGLLAIALVLNPCCLIRTRTKLAAYLHLFLGLMDAVYQRPLLLRLILLILWYQLTKIELIYYGSALASLLVQAAHFRQIIDAWFSWVRDRWCLHRHGHVPDARVSVCDYALAELLIIAGHLCLLLIARHRSRWWPGIWAALLHSLVLLTIHLSLLRSLQTDTLRLHSFRLFECEQLPLLIKRLLQALMESMLHSAVGGMTCSFRDCVGWIHFHHLLERRWNHLLLWFWCCFLFLGSFHDIFVFSEKLKTTLWWDFCWNWILLVLWEMCHETLAWAH